MERFEITVDEVLEATGGKMLDGCLCTFFGIATDTRAMGPGQLFVALKGANYDGHDYVKEAHEKGALGAVVSKDVDVDDSDFFIIKVDDTRKALMNLAGFWRRKHKDLKVIAVTGTNGKTTTKEILRWLLSAVGPTVASVKSYNNDVGVPLSLLEIRGYHHFAVIEIGASNPGEIASLAKVVAPDVAVITNIGIAHLQGFKSQANIVATKGELLKSVNSDGFAVLNGDDPNFEELKAMSKVPVFTFGINREELDMKPLEVASQTASTYFTISDVQTALPMGGVHNIYNALAALTVVKGLDLDVARSARRLRGFTPPPMRSNLFYVGPVVVISDCYNSNPSSMAAAVRYFSEIPSPNKIVIMGDMNELGSESARYHTEIGDKLAESSIDTLIGVGSEVKATLEAFKKVEGKTALHFEATDRTELVNHIVESIEGGGAVLVKGSRFMKLEDTVSLLIRALKKQYGQE